MKTEMEEVGLSFRRKQRMFFTFNLVLVYSVYHVLFSVCFTEKFFYVS